MVGCHDRPSVAVTRGANLRAIAARCRSDVGGRSAGRGRELLLLRREAAAEPRLGGTTAIANGQLTRQVVRHPRTSGYKMLGRRTRQREVRQPLRGLIILPRLAEGSLAEWFARRGGCSLTRWSNAI